MWDLSPLTRDQTGVPCAVRWILYHWTSREVPGLHVDEKMERVEKEDWQVSEEADSSGAGSSWKGS